MKPAGEFPGDEADIHQAGDRQRDADDKASAREHRGSERGEIDCQGNDGQRDAEASGREERVGGHPE